MEQQIARRIMNKGSTVSPTKSVSGAQLTRRKKKVCKDMLENSSSTFLWSKKLCERTKIPDRGAQLLTVKASCHCVPDMGFRVQAWEQMKINPKIKQLIQPAEDGSTVIGHKCARWMQDDVKSNRKWCVVGFDSACADRRLKIISAGRKIHVFTSAIPCERKGGLYVMLSEAGDKCRLLRTILNVAVWLSYILWPLMFFVVYEWQSHRCRDEDGKGSDHGWGACEVESDEASLKDSSSSISQSTGISPH